VIDNAAQVSLSYNKVHLVHGFEKQFTPGSAPGLFPVDGKPAAVAICKDLDFQDYIRQYGQHRPAVMFVPAWDFTVDDWLHARMAVLRSVENGFSMVRAARLGQLTISDCYGRVLASASSAEGQEAVLMGNVPLQGYDTCYATYGDWPGVACMVGALVLLLLAIKKRSTPGFKTAKGFRGNAQVVRNDARG
jgi:apolipoprotein N-acyltransferase